MLPGKARAKNRKNKLWTVPTVLGLVLGVLGAVGIIELRPQVMMSPLEQIDKSQPFSAPFRITNTGYFSFHVDRVVCNDLKVQIERFAVEDSAFLMSDNFDLERGVSRTVFCRIATVGPGVSVTAADIAISVDISPFAWFPSHRRQFHFIGTRGDNWQWLEQPMPN
jgi:hypothetical protein